VWPAPCGSLKSVDQLEPAEEAIRRGTLDRNLSRHRLAGVLDLDQHAHGRLVFHDR
jgi:hypothetical protein